MLESKAKRRIPVQPRLIAPPPPAFPTITTHTLETFLLPKRFPAAVSVTLRFVPRLAAGDDDLDELPSKRPVYRPKGPRTPSLPLPDLHLTVTRPPGPMNPAFQPPVGLAGALRFPAVASAPWSWIHASAAKEAEDACKQPLLLLPIHFDASRLRILRKPQRSASAPLAAATPPTSEATTTSAAPESAEPAPDRIAIPRYDAAKPARQNSAVGIVWKLPVSASPPPRALQARKLPPPSKPSNMVVCDHQCVRRVYPTINMHVKNLSDAAIVISAGVHFAEVTTSLEFDRKHAYGYVFRVCVDACLRIGVLYLCSCDLHMSRCCVCACLGLRSLRTPMCAYGLNGVGVRKQAEPCRVNTQAGLAMPRAGHPGVIVLAGLHCLHFMIVIASVLFERAAVFVIQHNTSAWLAWMLLCWIVICGCLHFCLRRRYRLHPDAFTFPPRAVSVVTLAAADPNFFSRTMMVPLSDTWVQVRALIVSLRLRSC